MSNTSSAQHGGFAIADTRATGSFLRTHFAVGTVDFRTPFGGCETAARGVTFEDHGALDNVPAERSVEEGGGEFHEADGLEGGEAVEGGEDSGG